jgi:hypothetical protein
MGWKAIVFLLVVGCLVGIHGIVAWIRSSDRGTARLLQTGPALLIPVVLLWTLISHYSCRDECSSDSWRTLPFYAAVGAAIFWNVALISRNKERLNFYIPYAFFFVPLFFIFSTLALVVAVKFPL